MSNILLPIIFNGLPQGYCFTDWNQLGLDLSNAQNAVLANGRSFYNIGDSKPAPELQQYPWINTAFRNLIFTFQGVWRCPTGYDPNERRLWVGDLTQLITYDGGSAGTVTPTTGPMWVSDDAFIGRSPMGPGLIPGSTVPSPKTLAVGEQYGNAEATLTEQNGAVGAHTHPMGVCDPSSDDAVLAIQSPSTVPTYAGHFITGDGTQNFPTETTANLFTLPSGTAGTGVAATPFSIVHPVTGSYVIKPSGRLYYVVP